MKTSRSEVLRDVVGCLPQVGQAFFERTLKATGQVTRRFWETCLDEQRAGNIQIFRL